MLSLCSITNRAMDTIATYRDVHSSSQSQNTPTDMRDRVCTQREVQWIFACAMYVEGRITHRKGIGRRRKDETMDYGMRSGEHDAIDAMVHDLAR